MEENNQSSNEELKALDEKELATENQENQSVDENLKQLLDQEKDKYIRLFAEFENYKKRVLKERMELFKTAGQEVLVSLLPVLDDFERCLKELHKSESTEITKGIELIHSKFSETLKNKGLTKMEINQGDDFDVDKHEAITQIPSPNEESKNKIIDTIENGYLLGEKVIRFAKVVIGK